MKKKFLGKFLGLALAAVLAISSSVPSMAAEDISVFAAEDVAYEEVLEELPEETEENVDESVAEEAEEAAEAEDQDEAPEAEEAEEAEETEEAEASEEDVVEAEEAAEAEEVVTEAEEETVLTEETETPAETPAEEIPVEEPVEEPIEEPAEEPVVKDKYSITYDLDGGTCSKKPASYKPGKKVTLPKAKKKGYKFLGWIPASENAADVEMKKVQDADGNEISVAVAIKKDAKADISLTARYEAIRFKLYLDPNGKGVTNVMGDPDQEDSKRQDVKKKVYLGVFNYDGDKIDVEGEECFEIGLLEKKGAEFVAFSLKKNPKSEKDYISEENLAHLTTKKSATLYCVWEKIPYTLGYLNEIAVADSKDNNKPYVSGIDDSKGEFVEEKVIYNGKSYKLKTIKAPGCTFLAWKIIKSEDPSVAKDLSVATDSDGFALKVKADNASDVILHGYYVENACTLKFNTNGGTYGEKKAKGSLELIDGFAKPVTHPEDIENAMKLFAGDVEKTGYTFKGIALDKKGKKLITDANGVLKEGYDLRTISKKLNAKVTVYAAWEKTKTPKKSSPEVLSDEEVFTEDASSEEATVEIPEEETPSDETPSEETPSEETPEKAVQYTVKFNLNGRTYLAAVDYDSADTTKQSTIEAARLLAVEEGKDIPLKWVYKNGYSASWFYDAECTKPADMEAVVSGDLELFGKWVLSEEWSSEEITFVYHANNGSKDVKVKKTYKYEDAEKALGEGTEAFSKKGYKLGGWTLSLQEDEMVFEPETTVQEIVTGYVEGNSIDLYASWAPIHYSFMFYNNDGSEFPTQPTIAFDVNDFSYEDEVEFTAAADYLGAYFDEGTTVTGFSKKKGGKADFVIGKKYKGCSDTEGVLALYAVTKTDTYAIGYELEDGDLSKGVYTYRHGKKTVLPKASKIGYKFNGWLCECDNADYLQFKKGTNADGQTVSYVTAIKPKAQGSFYFVADYTLVNYKVYVAPNGSGVKNGDKAFKKNALIGTYTGEGEEIAKDEYFYTSNLSRKGYDFVGLSLNSKAKTAEECITPGNYAFLSSKEKVTLYCIWAKKTYHVRFRNEAVLFSPASAEDKAAVEESIMITDVADEFYEDQVVTYGKKPKLKDASIIGTQFVGYKLEGSSDAKVTTKEKSGFKVVTKVNADNEADIVLVPVFIQYYFTLSFDPNGGVFTNDEGTKTDKFAPFDECVFPVNDREMVDAAVTEFKEGLSREGYTLKGLYLDPKGKKPLPEDIRTAPKKYNDNVTVYAVWKKNKKK